MAAALIRDPNPDSPFRTVRISGQAYAIGDIVDWDRTSDAIDVVPCTAASKTTSIAGVAMEAQTSSGTTLLICLFRPGQEWLVDSVSNSSSSYRYFRMIWATGHKVTNNTTDVTDSTGIFTQTGEVSTAASKKLIGTFNVVGGIAAA